MEGSVVDNLRSRSRSRSNTPLLQAHPEPTPRLTEFETVPENEPEIFTSPPAHRTRNALKQKSTIIEQGNENSNFTLANDIISPITKDNFLSEEIAQNIKNYSYEYEQTTSTHTSSWQVINGNRAHSSFTSPYDLHRRNNSGTSHSRLSSSCSVASNESFAESVLADSSKLSYEGVDHLPYRLYKFAIEYWNKYPKTDYTYSHLSRDRVELAPGQIAVPNMSRLSLAQYRQGASVYNGGLDEDESAALLSRCQELRQRKNTETTYSQNTQFRSDNLIDSDYDETDTYASRYAASVNSSNNRWWITRLLISILTTITTATTTVKNKILRRGTNQRYPYYSTRHSAYSENKSIFTTVKETAKKRKWLILFFLLLLLPLLFIYTYPETLDNIPPIDIPSLPDFIVQDFSKIELNLPDFSYPKELLHNIGNMSFPDLAFLKVNLSQINLPNITMSEFNDKYHTYKTVAGDKLYQVIDYILSSGKFCYDEIQSFFTNNQI